MLKPSSTNACLKLKHILKFKNILLINKLTACAEGY